MDTVEMCRRMAAGAWLRCECCGEGGHHHGCTLLPGRRICERCVSVWYDTGLTNPVEIDEESRRWRDDPDHWYNVGRRTFGNISRVNE